MKFVLLLCAVEATTHTGMAKPTLLHHHGNTVTPPT